MAETESMLMFNYKLLYKIHFIFIFIVNAGSPSTFKDLQLDIRNTDMLSIVRAMARLDSGLEIRDRMWLKIIIPNSFIGKIIKSCIIFLIK